MTNYIIPTITPSGEALDLSGLKFPCRITDLRTGTEYVLESAEGNPVKMGLQASDVTVEAFTPMPSSAIMSLDGTETPTAFDTDAYKPVWFVGGEWYYASGDIMTQTGGGE